MALKNVIRCMALAVALVGGTSAVSAAPYVVGGASESLIGSGSGEWSWDGDYLTGFRSALENPANFGPTGTVDRTIQTVTLSSVDAVSLAGVDMFVATWISDGHAIAMNTAVTDFFLSGGDLFLLQDDSSHDGLGASLGLSTTTSTGSVSNGGAPLFDGPFGVATNVAQLYAVGQLDPLAIAAKNGHVGGTNADGQVTSAYWKAGEYAPGAGALFIIADIDMIATTTACGLAVCGASFAPLNDNGIYALNTFSFLQSQGGSPPVPEPEAYALMLAGLAVVLGIRSRRREG
ncbi:MAG TPA: PEP-CTERM sorting domain-containing protein [Aquabacterium sp.]|uniref:PEP-CTERM sorting domain-containing protein n=1 Tax=Aquabacterium sp. TaxID=1872578 RepID=UPI002E31E5F1|nr:PEP-CTERM sorting domain-containing protein [Aquabacterium sp.]HEX5372060.1 PEP-CTERM sorting domain-containing protein [Aquabacterium sp.]